MVESADTFNSVSDVERSLIAILLFVILWGVGFVFICIHQSETSVHSLVARIQKDVKNDQKENEKEKTKSHTRGNHPQTCVNSKVVRIEKEGNKDGHESEKEKAKIILTQYLDEIFPTVFQTESAFVRLTSEVMKHHRYLILFLGDRQTTGRQRSLICLQMLTVQSMLMFMLAALYEIQVWMQHTNKMYFSFPTLLMDIYIHVFVFTVSG